MSELTRPNTEFCPACSAVLEGNASSCFQCGHTRRLFGLKKGQIIAGRYELTGVLGQGGMGTVYEVHDQALDERLALKVLSEAAQGSPDADRRFRAEIKLARKIRHANVCAIHEYGQLKDMQYIVMEFVEGQDLKKYLRSRGELAAREAIDLACQIGEGLQAIHDAGVIHRDLKSANVMRDRFGRTRLMDFGIAKPFGDTAATATGQIIGTPEYMSPEQARGEHLDQRSDVYSLAIVTYEMLTGRVPFKADTPLGTIMLQVHEPPRLDQPAIPLVLAPILGKGLAKSPDDRYESARDFVSALRSVQDYLPALPPGPIQIGEVNVEPTTATALPTVTSEAPAPAWLAPALAELTALASVPAPAPIVSPGGETTVAANAAPVASVRPRQSRVIPQLGAVALALVLALTVFLATRVPREERTERWNNQVVYGEASVEKSPLLISHEQPAIKLEPGRIVTVVLSWIVTPDGKVDDARINTPGTTEIDAVVIEAIRKWSYEPGLKNGKAVPVRVIRKYTFGNRGPIGPQPPTFSASPGSQVTGCNAGATCNLSATVSFLLLEEAPKVEVVTEMVTERGQVCLTSRSGNLGRITDYRRTLPNFTSRCKPPFKTTTIFLEVLSGSTTILRQSFSAAFQFN